ncbi:NACHT, LRR and PYD domains-containing protein 1b allele 3-like isoform X2 [Hyla sarda]|uniref:NACHT, LRR and PYD domains-containing protein 1b allele 3-like isoform X2 n=1 Tax=Hyla sarda TaxID=327740 RepID=UPI0024C3EC3C|nr:NACHT, LRR and PYD domains-containing protein 1b allele 3-like isoform X2 [Hyla sarda]
MLHYMYKQRASTRPEITRKLTCKGNLCVCLREEEFLLKHQTRGVTSPALKGTVFSPCQYGRYAATRNAKRTKSALKFGQVMKETNRGTVSKILSIKIIAGHKMATGPSVKAKEQPDLEPTFISDKEYRIENELMFHCKETGIKFEMQPETIIKYSLEYGEEYMKLIEENGYELLGPIFNVEVISGRVSEVYLPHYVRLEGFSGEKSMKFGHIKDGKVNLKTPTRIEDSYVVLENPSFSRVAAVGKSIASFFKREKYPFNGQFLMYARVLCPEEEEFTEYRIHLYLIPTDRPNVQALDDMKESKGFQKIEKPWHTDDSVSPHIKYIISGEPDADIRPKTLQFLIHERIEKIPYSEINVLKTEILKNRNSVLLRVKAERSSRSELVWEGELRRDIEELTRQGIKKGDRGKNFIHKHRSVLIQEVKNIMPVLDDLRKKELLTKEQSNKIIISHSTPQDQMRSLLSYVESWGSEDQITFYEALKSHNKPTIKKIEKGN